jgi:hypothetical protein
LFFAGRFCFFSPLDVAQHPDARRENQAENPEGLLKRAFTQEKKRKRLLITIEFYLFFRKLSPISTGLILRSFDLDLLDLLFKDI